jgi:hypothetical protein
LLPRKVGGLPPELYFLESRQDGATGMDETGACSSTFEAAMTLDTPRRLRTPEETRRNRRRRLPILALGLSFFLAALYGGLWRIGWPLPHGEGLGEIHGPLMICGFFGALIGLERAVALKRPWAFATPWLACAGALCLIAGAPLAIPATLFAAAAAILTLASILALRDDPRLFTAVLAGAAACWGLGAIVWLRTEAVASAAPWWLLFLALTIAAERLDMSRIRGLGRVGAAAFLACVGALVAGACLGLFDALGAPMLGCGLIALSAWLLRHDLALGKIGRAPPLRFFGFAMCAGYLWMAVAGAGLVFAPPAVAPYGYDLALHAVLVGFVVSMAFGHSVIVIPAITGAAAPYHPAMYAGLALLHASVALRVCGDLGAFEPVRMASGGLTFMALLAFGGVLAWRIAAARRGA